MPLFEKTAFAACLLCLLLAPSAALAQRISESGQVKRQNPAQQMEAAAVGDTVVVILDEASYRRVPGTVAGQNRRVILLTAPNGSTRSFDRGIIYAVLGMGAEAKARRADVRRQRLAQADFGRGKLLVFPTARVSEPGQGTIYDTQIFFPYLSYSLPVFPLEVRAGSSILPMTAQQIYASAKAPLYQSTPGATGRLFTVSAGALGAVSSNYWTAGARDEAGGAVFALATYDLRARRNRQGKRSETTAVTGGAGYVFTGGVIENGPVFMAGFEHRRGGRFKFLSEAAYLPLRQAVLGSAGLRYVGSRISVEGGLLTGTPFIGSSLPVLPVVTFGYRLF